MKLYDVETNDEYLVNTFESGNLLILQNSKTFQTIELRHYSILFHDNTISIWGLKSIGNRKYESSHFEFYNKKKRK